MAGADRDKMLREMAQNRGCKLVKSRRRTPGVGDYGRYGLTTAAGQEVFGFGKNGLEATADDIEAYLRASQTATWKTALKAAGAMPKPKPARKVERSEPEPRPEPAREKPRPRPEPPPKPPEPKLVIREARPGDAKAIAGLIAELGFKTSPKEMEKRLAALKKAGEPPLVADRGGILGCLTWHSTPNLHRPYPVGRVTMLVVTKSARGRGIGRALVEAAGARLGKAGCGLLEVTSNIDLGGAHDFYRRLGFKRTSYRFVREIGSPV